MTKFKNVKKIRSKCLKLKKWGIIFKLHVDLEIYYKFTLFFFGKPIMFLKVYIFISFFKVLAILQFKGITIFMIIAIIRRCVQSNKRIIISHFQWFIGHTKCVHFRTKWPFSIDVIFIISYIFLHLLNYASRSYNSFYLWEIKMTNLTLTGHAVTTQHKSTLESKIYLYQS
jgi:hypothetical protein